MAGFLAGLIEGEACFAIRKQARGTNHSCSMTVTMREDETKLLVWLATRTALGGLVRREAQGNARPQISWQVTAKADCLRLCELLYVTPLRGRTSLQFAIWSAAVRAWIGKGATHTERNRDWAALAYLKQRLHESKLYAGVADRALPPDGIDCLRGDWSPFLAGYVTAEGHLGLHRNGKCLAPRFQIAVRDDDLALLHELRVRIGGFGRIYRETHRSARCHPSAVWMVRDGAGLASLVSTFDRCPPRGRRGREYRIWRKAALAYASSEPRARVQERLRDLQPSLAAAHEGTGATSQ